LVGRLRLEAAVAAGHDGAGGDAVSIVKIEPDGEEDCVCIAVSHPSRLYVTENGIVTHNTTVDNQPSGASLGNGQQNVTSAKQLQHGGLAEIEAAIASSPEITALGVTIERIDSVEASRRGYPQSLNVGALADGRLIVVTDRLQNKTWISAEAAQTIVREEVIHLAWYEAMRARWVQSATSSSFDSWFQAQMRVLLTELAGTAAGQQSIVDAANAYFGLYGQSEMFQSAGDVRTDLAMRDASEAVMDSLNAEGLCGDALMQALRSSRRGFWW